MPVRFILLSIICAIFCPIILAGPQQEVVQEKPIVVIIPSYNNLAWYKKNIDMLIAQDKHFSRWLALYVDDCSSDGTADAVEQYVKECGYEHKIVVVKNKERVGALGNIHRMGLRCRNDMIIVVCDGDDWFAHDQVLATINQAYHDPNVWMTYGQFVFHLGPNREKIGQCEPLPQEIIANNSYRSYKWVTSAPRTFYAGLLKRVKLEDLLYEGQYYMMAGDLALMFPMLEMAGGRVRFISDVLYIYNCSNPISDFRTSATQQEIRARYVRALPPYQKIDSYR